MNARDYTIGCVDLILSLSEQDVKGSLMNGLR